MKKLFTLILGVLSMGLANAQTWTTYDGSTVPESATPAWTTGDKGTTLGGTYSSVIDPEDATNYLLKYFADQTAKNSFKANFATTLPLEATMEFRAKATNAQSYGLQVEVSGGIAGGSRVDIKLVKDATNGDYVQMVGTSTVTEEYLKYPIDITAWHVYRVTVSGGNTFKMYIDGNTTPAMTVTSTRASTSAFMRFGYFTSTGTCEGYVDYMKWTTDGVVTGVKSELSGGTVVSTEFYSLTGVLVANAYADLKPGIYLQKSTYDNGKVTTTKISKVRP